MQADQLWRIIADAITRYKATGGNPLCPFHDDKHSGSSRVSRRGYYCFSCEENSPLHKLAQHLQLDPNSSWHSWTACWAP